jgi:hypothetical protein
MAAVSVMGQPRERPTGAWFATAVAVLVGLSGMAGDNDWEPVGGPEPLGVSACCRPGVPVWLPEWLPLLDWLDGGGRGG